MKITDLVIFFLFSIIFLVPPIFTVYYGYQCFSSYQKFRTIQKNISKADATIVDIVKDYKVQSKGPSRDFYELQLEVNHEGKSYKSKMIPRVMTGLTIETVKKYYQQLSNPPKKDALKMKLEVYFNPKYPEEMLCFNPDTIGFFDLIMRYENIISLLVLLPFSFLTTCFLIFGGIKKSKSSSS
jgi:hypothetical protein